MVVCDIGKLTQDIEVNEGSQAVRRQVSELRFAQENVLEFKENLGHTLHYIAHVCWAASEINELIFSGISYIYDRYSFSLI